MILLFFSPAYLFAQEEGKLLNLADGLFKSGAYEHAITEYKRFLFFHPDSPYKPETLIKIGYSFRELGNYQYAGDFFLRAARETENLELQIKARLEHALLSIALKEYTKAEFELYQLSSIRNIPPELQKKIDFHLALLFVNTGKWEKAKKPFCSSMQDYPETLQKIIGIIDRAAIEKRKDPLNANILSTIVPGLGQMYAGDFLDGLNALVVNGAVFFLMGYTLANRLFPEAALTFSYLFLRFYPGNIYQAGKKAIKYNMEINQKYAGEIYSLLDSIIAK